MRFNEEIYDQLTEGERHLVQWQYDFAGGFTKALWTALTIADRNNLARLALGFPDDVEAYKKFSREAGWWPALQKRLNQGVDRD
jgi:hypothetical protein